MIKPTFNSQLGATDTGARFVGGCLRRFTESLPSSQDAGSTAHMTTKDASRHGHMSPQAAPGESSGMSEETGERMPHRPHRSPGGWEGTADPTTLNTGQDVGHFTSAGGCRQGRWCTEARSGTGGPHDRQLQQASGRRPRRLAEALRRGS